VLILRTILINLTTSQECDTSSDSSPNLTVIHTSGQNITRGENFIDLIINTTLHLKCESNEQIVWLMPHPVMNVELIFKFIFT
jgi:hypothetical protein